MKYKLSILIIMTFLFIFPADVFSDDQKIGLTQILKTAQEKYSVLNLANTKREAYELEAIDQASLDNPVVSYGIGRLRYNGGTGTADYEEFSVSQKITINGSKASLKKQGRLLGEIAAIEGTQSKINLSSRALLAGIRFFIAKETFHHIEERRHFFTLVSRFLKSRKFISPQKQLEVLLIESKLEEVILETDEVKSSLDLAKEVLRLYIGDFSEKSIEINLLENSKLKLLSEKLSKEDLAETKIFSKKQNYFNAREAAAGRKWIPDLQLYHSQSNEKYSRGDSNQVIGLGVEVPLFNRGKNKKDALLAQKVAAETEYKINKSRNLSFKKSILKKIRVGIEYLTMYDAKKINSREKALKIFSRDFKKGLISAANFLEFEDSVHTIHRHKLESQYEIYDGLLNLIELSGDESALKELL